MWNALQVGTGVNFNTFVFCGLGSTSVSFDLFLTRLQTLFRTSYTARSACENEPSDRSKRS